MPNITEVTVPGEEEESGGAPPIAIIVKNTFDATVAPTTTNDTSEGYSVGSRWINTTLQHSYVCKDNTASAAVWELSVKSTFDAAVAPAITNDIDEGYTIGSMWVDTVLQNAYICTNNTDGAAVWKIIV